MSRVVRLAALECARAMLFPTCRSHFVTKDRIKPGLWIVTGVSHLGTWTDKLRGKVQCHESGSSSTERNNKEDPASVKHSSTPSKSDAKYVFSSTGERADKSMKELEQMLEKKEGELKEQLKLTKEFKDKFMRALAEMENVRQRMQKQIEEARLFGIQEFAKDIIEVADVLEKATGSVSNKDLEDNSNLPLASLLEGLKLTEAQLQKVLLKNGLTKVDEVGNVFDPKIHEALFELPGEKPGTVAVISRVGYILNGRTLRAAKVGVVKANQF